VNALTGDCVPTSYEDVNALVIADVHSPRTAMSLVSSAFARNFDSRRCDYRVVDTRWFRPSVGTEAQSHIPQSRPSQWLSDVSDRHPKSARKADPRDLRRQSL
jgi:hypothetical protein